MAKTITVRIENGKAVVSTKGFQGKSCVDATKQLESALGIVKSDRPTAEMHKPATQKVSQS